MNRLIAVADIGGTHARFALAEVRQGCVVSLGDPVTLKTSEHESLNAAWAAFGRSVGREVPNAFALAFAGSIGGKMPKLTNSRWVIQPNLLREQLGLDQVTIINDFGAVAHAVAQFGPEHFDHLHGPDVALPDTGLITVIGPGTGLGVAQLLRVVDGYHVIETEGGHIDFAPLDKLEQQILTQLRRQHQRVSIERIVSGSGLTNLYRAMAKIEGKPAVLSEGESIWTSALNGSDPLAASALDRFLLSFGAVAGDLALAHGAGAVVIAGALSQRIKDRLAESGFAGRFVAKGRFRERMEAIPVKLLKHPQPGLFGAAAAFAKEHP
jgi:glucokinase